jgi:hypothetical protein
MIILDIIGRFPISPRLTSLFHVFRDACDGQVIMLANWIPPPYSPSLIVFFSARLSTYFHGIASFHH